jgi:hypothetical protein
VFCGAKQPPTPAIQQGLGKTAFGYSANDVLEQVKQGRPQPPSASTYNQQLGNAATMAQPPMPRQVAPSVPAPMPRQVAPSAPAPMPAPMQPAFAPPPPMGSPPAYPAAPPPGGFVPLAAANARTMFVQAGPPGPTGPSQPPPSFLQGGSPAAMGPTLVPPTPQALTMPAPAPAPQMRQPQAPIMAIPAAQPPPYLSSQTGSRVIRPIDPWQDSVRAMMFLWGLALLAAFCTPLATSPELVFQWATVLHGEGIARLPPLLIGAIGLLSIILAVIPMPTAPRGLIATLLALAGIGVPIALAGNVPQWQLLAPLVGMVLLLPGLLIRSEYRDALLPRLLVTLGAAGVLAPTLIPQNNAIPLVSVFKELIEQPGLQKIEPALALGMVFVVVMSLLAWLPSPATGAAKLWAWLLILWPLISHAVHVARAGNLADAVSHAPNQTLVPWIASGTAGGSAYLVLLCYGLASALGRQLE